MVKNILFKVSLVLVFLLSTVDISHSRDVTVENVRHWSETNYTRIVIDLSGETDYKYHLLKKDEKLNKPRRLFIDVSNSKLGPELSKSITIEDGLLKGARAGQFKSDVVRVVLDIEKIEDYKVFHLKEPFRIVVDISGRAITKKEEKEEPASETKEVVVKDPEPVFAPEPDPNVLPPKTKPEPEDKAKEPYKVNTIVLDAGHGGKDPGAIGKGKLYEKDLTLKITKLVEERLSKKFKGKIILTRDKDIFIPLDERTAIANMKQADLFVSIHINASPNKKARGVETYFLDYASDKRSKTVAARENATSIEAVDDDTLQFILNDLSNTANRHESSELATSVQGSLTGKLNKKYRNIKNHGVKGAPFYVLVGTRMPSILVEVAFISNPEEAKRLRSKEYLDEVAEGISEGILDHIKKLEN